VRIRADQSARLSALCLLLVLSTGCGLFGEKGKFRDRKHDYLKAGSIEPLKMPPGMTEDTIEDIYRVPPIASGMQADRMTAVPRPPPLMAGSSEELVKIHSTGSEQWILVQLLPGQVWPRVKDFLLTGGMGVAAESGPSGEIETPWLSATQQAFQEAYRFRVLQGVQRSTTEVYVDQQQRRRGQGAGNLPAEWPPQSDDPRRAQLMLQGLASYLAKTADVNASVSLRAQDINVSQRLYLVAGEEPLIRLHLDPDRAWAALGHALERAQFGVVSGSPQSQVYRVSAGQVLEPEKIGAWKRFAGVFKTSEAKAAQQQEREAEFVLAPDEESGWMRIAARSADGQRPLTPEEQEALLNRILGYLS
jgi:outer membrane protein assembly factor BamC